MLRKSLIAAATIMSSLTLPACNRTVINNQDANEFSTLVGPGESCFLATSTLRKPGTIYRLNNSGTLFYVHDMSQTVSTSIGEETYGSLHRQSNSSLAGNLGLIGVGASLSGDWNSVNEWSFQLVGAEREILTDVAAKPIEDWFAAYEDYRQNDSYFLIREVLRSKSIDIQIDKKRIAGLGGEAKIQSVVDAKANWKYQRDAEYQLQSTFEQPQSVCMKPEQLVRTTSGTASGGIRVTLTPVSEPLPIRSISN